LKIEMRRSSSGEKKNKRKSKTAPSLELGSLREQLSEGSLLNVGSNTNINNFNTSQKSPKDANFEDKSPKPSDPSTHHHHSSKKTSEASETKKKLREYGEELKSELGTELTRIRDSCLTHLQRQLALLNEAREELTRDRALVEVQQRALQAHSGTRVTLNVGGVLYATSRTTLTRYPNSMFAAMFSGRFNNDHVDACEDSAPDTPSTGTNPAYFIDRDGALFSHVLNYLRTGTLQLTVACEWESDERGGHTPHALPAPEPVTPELRAHLQQVSAVLEEAEYYNLVDLAHICRTDLTRHRQRLKSTNHNTPRSRADSAYESNEECMYTRKEVHQMLVSHQHVLITYQGHGTAENKPLLNLAGVNLSYIDLSRLDLSYVDFSRANLEGANLESCILLGTVFSQCNLQRANLQQCSFGHARTERESATFVDANLRGANFSRFLGVIYRNNMEGANLADTIGLDEKWLA
jgi:hypothetical protein